MFSDSDCEDMLREEAEPRNTPTTRKGESGFGIVRLFRVVCGSSSLCVSASLRFFRSLNRGLNCQRGKIPCSALSPSVFDARTSHRDLKRHGD